MSTPLARTPRASAGTAPTRQQLDELDALLQRMLELPVHPGEEGDEEARLPDLPAPRKAAPPPPPPRVPQARPVPPRAEARVAEPPRRSPPAAPPPPDAEGPRAYPASYMVVETSAPNYLTEPHEADAGLAPRVVPPLPPVPASSPGFELPVPGGRHDLEADDPVDPAEELARLKASLEEQPEDWVPFQSSWQPSEQTWKPLVESWEQARTVPPPPPPGAPPPHEAPARAATLARPAPREMPRQAGAPGGPVVVTQTEAPVEAPPVAQPVYRTPVAPPVFSYPAAQDQPDPAAAPAPVARTKPVVNPPPEAPPATPPAASRPVVVWPLVAFNVVFDVFLTPWGPPGKWLKGKKGRNFLAAVGFLCLAGAAALAVADGIGWNW
jgi:hypothetical protein